MDDNMVEKQLTELGSLAYEHDRKVRITNHVPLDTMPVYVLFFFIRFIARECVDTSIVIYISRGFMVSSRVNLVNYSTKLIYYIILET